MERSRRIEEMEARLNSLIEVNREMEKALTGFLMVRRDVEELNAYYTGEEWKQDRQDDEEGKLPADLKRGVLSEDGIYNALSDYEALADSLCETAMLLKKK